MRMRKNPWVDPELAACPVLLKDADARRGRWREGFSDPTKPLVLELGCGKCVQGAAAAQAMPQVNYLAIDEVEIILAFGSRTIRKVFQGEVPGNLRLCWADAVRIREWMAPEDGVGRIYISFCNPWGKRRKYHKRRLTHPRQLMQYRDFLPEDGEIWFKTDDRDLFMDSQKYFERCGFEVAYYTEDLHASGFAPNFVSEHEMMYTAKGLPTYFCIVRKAALPEGVQESDFYEYD